MDDTMIPCGERPLSYGEKAVGLTFNPSNDPAVHNVKQMFADLIDAMNDLRMQPTPGASAERARAASIAITELQTAQMWAVKALTWRD